MAQIAQSYYAHQNAARIDIRVLEAVVVLIDTLLDDGAVADDFQAHQLRSERDRIAEKIAVIRTDVSQPVHQAVTRVVEIAYTLVRETRPDEEVRRELAGVMKKLDAIMATIEPE